MTQTDGASHDVGIAIVNYRSHDLLAGMIERWDRDAVPRRRIAKIVVVDNDPGFLDPARWPTRLPLEYISLGGNRGYAAGVNRGWSALETEYVLLLNPDADIGLDSIERMADVLDGLPAAGALAPLHVDFDGRPANPYHTLPTWLDLASHGTHLYRFAWAKRRVRIYQCDELNAITSEWPMTPVEQPPASCLLVRRRAIDGLPMDDRFPIFFNDVDLSMQLRTGGWKTFIIPDIIFRHVPASSTQYLGIRGRAEGYLGAYRYIGKWYGVARANLYRSLLIPSLGVSARDQEVRAENIEAIRALVTERSVFETSTSADPVRAFWPDDVTDRP